MMEAMLSTARHYDAPLPRNYKCFVIFLTGLVRVRRGINIALGIIIIILKI